MKSLTSAGHILGLFTLLFSYIPSTCCADSTEKKFTPYVYRHKPKTSSLIHVTDMSRLPHDLACLKLNNIVNSLTGYAYYRNVAFDPQIAINPKNPKNMVIVAQQDVLTNGNYGGALALSAAVLYTVDGGQIWNHSNLVLSRCQGATNYKADNNFLSAYFPSVTFDPQGNCYVLTTSYNLFAADEQVTISTDEGNIVAKSLDGGATWNQVSAATYDDGTCHFLDFAQIKADPYRKNTLYIISADNTCFVSETCLDPGYTGNQNITFQKSTNAGSSWSPISLIASLPVNDINQCTPIPIFNQLEVLPDHHKTLLVTSMLEESSPDVLPPIPTDRIVAWRSKDGGDTWHKHTVADNIPHVLTVDPDFPELTVTDFTTKDMAINHCNGYAYVVYSDPQFNSNGEAGCAIRKSSDGGKTWSLPRPVNPKTSDVQTFLPTVAVAKDGTVGVLFYDFRNFTSGDPELYTDVWMTFFDKELHHYYGEVRLTKQSFDARKSIRGYNGIDQPNCSFDYYLSSHVGLKANGNDFVASFVVTNEACDFPALATFPCDSFPVSTEDCNRQDVVFVNICRH